MDERDFNLIRNFFARMSGLRPEAADTVAENISGGLAGKLGLAKGETINPIAFIKTVVALYREK